MSIWQIIVLIICILIYIFAVYCEYDTYKYHKKKGWEYHCSWQDILKITIAPLRALWMIIVYVWYSIHDYYSTVKEHGGIRGHREWKKQEAIDTERRKEEREKEQKEYERIKNAYLAGELTRSELPRVEDGEFCFEFNLEMGLYVNYVSNVREIVYVERKYNKRLNRFFREHKDLRLYNMYKFIYLPNLCDDLQDGDLLHYLYPNVEEKQNTNIALTSSYPLQHLAYQEDESKIEQGMFFFCKLHENHGVKYIKGDYHPLHEGSDEEIIEQLDAIVKEVHNRHSLGGLYSKAERPQIEVGSTDEYADEMFYWETINPEVAKLMKEVQERIEKLKEYGLGQNMLLNLVKEKQELSRLVITKDLRIILPDYHNMEIKMEPLVKAVYLLFLKHPEGIIFKHLPDYRKELAEIYQKIKPYGLNERAIRSIEDVTNPCLNSINEKCARIRGAFISQFDDSLAQKYYIYGWRGEAKKIALPRELVQWE